VTIYSDSFESPDGTPLDGRILGSAPSTTVPIASNIRGAAVSRNTGSTYVTCMSDDSLKVVDTVSGVVTASVPVGAGAIKVAVNETLGRAYVVNTNDDTITVVNLAHNTVMATIPVGFSPTNVAVDSVRGRAYTANSGSNTVTVIDETNTVVATISSGIGPLGVAVDTIGNRLFVTIGDGVVGPPRVEVYDGDSLTLIAQPSVSPGGPYGVTYNPTTERLYTVNLNANPPSVSVFETEGYTQIATINVDATPVNIALDIGAKLAFVSHPGIDLVTMINTETNQIAGGFGAPGTPTDVATVPPKNGDPPGNPDLHKVYVPAAGGGTLQTIQGPTAYAVWHINNPPNGLIIEGGQARCFGSTENSQAWIDIDDSSGPVTTTVLVPGVIPPDGTSFYVMFAGRSLVRITGNPLDILISPPYATDPPVFWETFTGVNLSTSENKAVVETDATTGGIRVWINSVLYANITAPELFHPGNSGYGLLIDGARSVRISSYTCVTPGVDPIPGPTGGPKLTSWASVIPA